MLKSGLDKPTCGLMRPSYPQSAQSSKLEIQHCMPVLYRFMAEQYIDEFLNDGKLMISTMPCCRASENSERADKHEALYRFAVLSPLL